MTQTGADDSSARRRRFSRQAERAIGEFMGVASTDPQKMHKRETRELAGLIEELRVKHRIGRAAPEDAVRDAWPELVGSANASYSHPLRIENRRLIVQATHSVVRNELFLHRREIVARVRQLPGCNEIKDLLLKAG